ncbi:ParA family protein [Aerococcus viridans]|uniref:ParA family protein n=1 Tax=Aerococcus viridans TaxID=1377 RepID=UPI003B20EA2D
MSPEIVSFINMKGGVGKTTLTINIAYTLAKHFEKNVLLIDMDPQFNATQSLMTKFKTLKEYENLRNEGKTINYVLQPPTGAVTSQISYNLDEIILNLYKNTGSNLGELDMIAGDLSITTFESSRRGSEKMLNEYIKKIEEEYPDKYDFILIDTPATYSIYSQSSLITSDFYVVPISPDVFSALGFSLLQKAMKDDLVLNDSQPEMLGILFTLTKDKVGRNRIKDEFDDVPTFEESLKEAEWIRTGNMSSFMLDMISTKDNIINIVEEFLGMINRKRGGVKNE